MTKKIQILGYGFYPHELAYGGLALFYALASGADRKLPLYVATYFILVGAAIPILFFREIELWRKLENKLLAFLPMVALVALFAFLGNSTFGYVDTPSLFHWMYNSYASESPVADDGHGLLIPFVVVGLFWWKRNELFAQRRAVWWPGIILLGFAVILHMVGYLVQQPRLCILAFFLGIYGAMGMAWGTGWLKACFFPFFLLLFMVPLGSLTEPVTFPLRLLVTKIVTFLSNDILGIGVVRQGTGLFNPSMGYQYEVAAACSGMRSLIAITAIAIIYAFMVFRSWNLRLVIMAAALPLAVIGNTFRMMAIVIASQLGGQKWGNYVHEGGPLGIFSLIPYVPAIIGLLLLGRWLEHLQDKRTDDNPPALTELKAAAGVQGSDTPKPA